MIEVFKIDVLSSFTDNVDAYIKVLYANNSANVIQEVKIVSNWYAYKNKEVMGPFTTRGEAEKHSFLVESVVENKAEWQEWFNFRSSVVDTVSNLYYNAVCSWLGIKFTDGVIRILQDLANEGDLVDMLPHIKTIVQLSK
jgi:hypothetical protein